jgi:hypothetical protein
MLFSILQKSLSPHMPHFQSFTLFILNRLLDTGHSYRFLKNFPSTFNYQHYFIV